MEIGCGRGVGIEILLGLGAAQVVGFDIDPRMVALAQKRVARYGPRAVAFIGDGAAIEAADASFDAVVGYGVLHHIPDWQRALREIARVLRPGGVFYFEEFCRGFVTAWPVRATAGYPEVPEFTGEQLRAWIEAAGLHVEKWRQLGEVGVIGRAGKSATPAEREEGSR